MTKTKSVIEDIKVSFPFGIPNMCGYSSINGDVKYNSCNKRQKIMFFK